MEDYYEYLDSNGVTTLYKLIKDDTVALIDSYSVTINGITTTLDNHVNNTDIHTPIATIEGMIDTAVGSLNYATPDYVDTKVADLVNSSPETLDTLKELSDALGNDSNFATTVANQIGSKANKDDVYTKQETDTLLEGKANSVHSHVVSDITDFPTIPTKTSQLINDSGFLTSSNGLITSVSWSDITNKPNFSTVAISNNYNDLDNIPTSLPANGGNATTVGGFTVGTNVPADAKFTDTVYTHPSTHAASMITGLATVATSGSYTDLSNTPTIPTKVSQLENDMGFGTGGDTSDCVHKTGDETITGIKTFTSGPWVTNNGTTLGYSIKNIAIARNDIPSEYQHYTFRAYDKNDKILGEYCVEKSTTGSTLLNMNVRSEDSNGKQLVESLCLNMSNDGSAVRFYPNSNNKVDLGMSNQKWAKVYSDDVVHTSGEEHIKGVKHFYNAIYGHQGVNFLNDTMDINTTPTSTIYSNIYFKDKNYKTISYIQYAHNPNGIHALGCFLQDSANKLYGVIVNSAKEFIPLHNNSYSLGSVTNKWKNVYATTFNGNLKGNADSSTKATQDSAGQQINKTYIKELSVSGRTITYKRGDNTTGTITTQDTNTTYSKLSQFTNDTGFITSSGSCNYATTAGSAGNGIDSSGANYIKFKDGTQICFGANKGGDIVTFANPFAFTPYISFGYNITTEIDRVIHGQAKFSSSTSFTMQVWDFNSNTWTNDRTTEWIAIGRWK